MSDISQGPGWWIASDGKWYPPADDMSIAGREATEFDQNQTSSADNDANEPASPQLRSVQELWDERGESGKVGVRGGMSHKEYMKATTAVERVKRVRELARLHDEEKRSTNEAKGELALKEAEEKAGNAQAASVGKANPTYEWWKLKNGPKRPPQMSKVHYLGGLSSYPAPEDWKAKSLYFQKNDFYLGMSGSLRIKWSDVEYMEADVVEDSSGRHARLLVGTYSGEEAVFWLEKMTVGELGGHIAPIVAVLPGRPDPAVYATRAGNGQTHSRPASSREETGTTVAGPREYAPVKVIEGAGWSPPVGAVGGLVIADGHLEVTYQGGSAHVPFTDLVDVQVEGGTATSGGGIMGGGFGVEGAAEGILVAGVLNALTTRKKSYAFLTITAKGGWTKLYLEKQNVDEVRRALRPLIDCAAENAELASAPVAPSGSGTGRDDLVEGLERLTKLRDSGALSDEEFATAKASLLSS